MHKQSEILLELEKACKASRRVENLYRDFELQKVCYIPLNVFILRPLHRLIHYKQILERLCKHYPATHVDFRDCRGAALKPEALFSWINLPVCSTLILYLWLISSCSGWCLRGGGAAPGESDQDGEPAEASWAKKRFAWCRQSGGSWSSESEVYRNKNVTPLKTSMHQLFCFFFLSFSGVHQIRLP